MKYILAHDFGTSSAKSALFTEQGDMVGKASYEYPTYRYKGNRVEQDPEDWWKAFCENNKILLQNIDISQIACVAFDGTVPDMLLLDRDLKPLHRALIWQDQRAWKEAEDYERIVPDELKGGRGALGPARGAMMLMWLKNNESELYGKAYKFVPSNSLYVVAKLTDRVVSDYELAFGTTLMKPDYSDWQYEIIEALEIDRSLLPELHDRTDVVGTVTKAAALQCGLAEGTPVVVGADDGNCNRLGCGIYKPGDAVLSAGTSGGAGGFGSDGKQTKIRGTQASGASMEWLRRIFCKEEEREANERGTDVFTVINEKIALSPVGARGVMFHPYLAGERGMRNNADARGSFVGLSLETQREDIMRAVVEGIALNLSLSVDAARSMGCPFESAPFIGGMSKGEMTRQIFADVTGARLLITDDTGYAACRGVAVLGGIGVGLFDDLSASERFVKYTMTVEPDLKAHEEYQKLKPVYEAVYSAQLPLYKQFHRNTDESDI